MPEGPDHKDLGEAAFAREDWRAATYHLGSWSNAHPRDGETRTAYLEARRLAVAAATDAAERCLAEGHAECALENVHYLLELYPDDEELLRLHTEAWRQVGVGAEAAAARPPCRSVSVLGALLHPKRPDERAWDHEGPIAPKLDRAVEAALRAEDPVNALRAVLENRRWASSSAPDVTGEVILVTDGQPRERRALFKLLDTYAPRWVTATFETADLSRSALDVRLSSWPPLTLSPRSIARVEISSAALARACEVRRPMWIDPADPYRSLLYVLLSVR